MEMDFLTPGIKQIRKSIKDIDDSYNNDWDILAELCQNSCDAIKLKKPLNPEITLEINAANKSIIIEDNGIGINPSDLQTLLAPFSTNKDGDSDSVGEKGVGLTFVLFSCNNFEIISGQGQGSKKGIIKDAFNWKTSTSDDKIKILLENISDNYQGTKIILNNIYDCPIFKLTFEQIKYVLRTKTALGNTNYLWYENEIEIKINLKFTNLDGEVFEDELENKYWMIYDLLDDKSKIDLNEFITYANDADKTDQDKRKKLKDKVIYKKGQYDYNGRTVKYVTCFVPKRKVWDDLSKDFNLCTQENLEDSLWDEEFSYTKFSSGIYTSVKGMPTGISIEHPDTGYAGYWSNIFIIFEDKQLKFDIGRKSIHGMISRIYKNFAREIFNYYLKYITKYVSGEVVTNTEWDRDDVFANIDNIIDLRNPKIQLVKNPKEYDGSVFGLFFECIGNKKIEEIIPLISGFRNKYDIYAKWGNKKLIIEVKSKLKNILKEYHDEQKLFEEVDMIVCWNVNEEDIQIMSNKGLEVEEISDSSLANKKRIPNCTHELILSGISKPIYILDLKKIIEK